MLTHPKSLVWRCATLVVALVLGTDSELCAQSFDFGLARYTPQANTDWEIWPPNCPQCAYAFFPRGPGLPDPWGFQAEFFSPVPFFDISLEVSPLESGDSMTIEVAGHNGPGGPIQTLGGLTHEYGFNGEANRSSLVPDFSAIDVLTSRVEVYNHGELVGIRTGIRAPIGVDSLALPERIGKLGGPDNPLPCFIDFYRLPERFLVPNAVGEFDSLTGNEIRILAEAPGGNPDFGYTSFAFTAVGIPQIGLLVPEPTPLGLLALGGGLSLLFRRRD